MSFHLTPCPKPLTYTIAAAAAALALAGCGGGGSGGGFIPPSTSASAIAKPDFTADVAGDYVFALVVNDGKADSAASSVTVSVALATWHDANCSPAADTGLPACTVDFSDNKASVTVVQESGAAALQ